MCGFCGFVAFADNPIDPVGRRGILEKMGQALANRGPDDQQMYDDGSLSLVFRRLSVVGSVYGKQPIFSESRGHLLVCNGEIYNHLELRRELAARHAFSTESDCEPLLHAFEEWGERHLERVRGMFASAIWDRANKRLFLARDRLGIKPLYVCELPYGILFGSELKALLAHPHCPRQTDWSVLDANPISMTATPSYVRGVDFLPGGCFLFAEQGRRPIVKRYWSLDTHIGSEQFGTNAAQYCQHYDHLIESSTLEHLQGQGPVGIHLSGGVDSALLTAIVGAKNVNAQCFTIVERTSYKVGDVQAAQALAKAFKLPWQPVLFDYQTVLERMDFGMERLEQSVWMMDSPLFDLEWIIKSELNRVIRTHNPELKILLLGQGADEFAGGYSKRIDHPRQNWQRYLEEEVIPMVRDTNTPEEMMALGRHSAFGALHAAGTTVSPFHKMMKLMALQLQHHNLWHEDRTSAMFGMEARVPFLDHRIVELLASVPEQLHASLFWNKQIVRDCMKRRVAHFDSARPKVGFCWTDDARTMEMITHGMACMASKAFLEKYVDAQNFPFDRQETMELIQKVNAREPGFYMNSFHLLSRMTASIFDRQHTDTQAYHQALQSINTPSRLEIIAAARWPAVHRHLYAEPGVNFCWNADHCVRTPAHTRIEITKTADACTTYTLVHKGNCYSKIEIPHNSTLGVAMFLQLMANPESAISVQELMDELGVGFDELTQFLNTLLACGFINTPVFSPTPEAEPAPEPIELVEPVKPAENIPGPHHGKQRRRAPWLAYLLRTIRMLGSRHRRMVLVFLSMLA